VCTALSAVCEVVPAVPFRRIAGIDGDTVVYNVLLTISADSRSLEVSTRFTFIAGQIIRFMVAALLTVTELCRSPERVSLLTVAGHVLSFVVLAFLTIAGL